MENVSGLAESFSVLVQSQPKITDDRVAVTNEHLEKETKEIVQSIGNHETITAILDSSSNNDQSNKENTPYCKNSTSFIQCREKEYSANTLLENNAQETVIRDVNSCNDIASITNSPTVPFSSISIADTARESPALLKYLNNFSAVSTPESVAVSTPERMFDLNKLRSKLSYLHSLLRNK